jgi:adenine-specific DNA methylase
LGCGDPVAAGQFRCGDPSHARRYAPDRIGYAPVQRTVHTVRKYHAIKGLYIAWFGWGPFPMSAYPKRLIEVDLPIKKISAHARREKSIRHGHISTLHIWWARRPLAACRAVLCAALWPDPVDPLCPPKFREDACRAINAFAARAASDKALAQRCSHDAWKKWQALAKTGGGLDARKEAHWNVLRFALLDFIADFADWDNSAVGGYLETARALTHSAHEALGGVPGTQPLVVDPFAGGGAIPLEALRVGADTFASDLNPIPVLLNKVALEYIPKYGQRLSDEVRKWGDWVRCEAEKQLTDFYPRDADGATSIAYIWARTILSDAPSTDPLPVEVPLLSSMWLSKKPDRGRALRWIREADGKVKCETVEKLYQGGRKLLVRMPLLEVFDPSSPNQVEAGTVRRGSATCPVTGFTTQVAQVRTQLQGRKGGTRDARLVCVVTTRPAEQGRFYRTPTEQDIAAAASSDAALTRMEATAQESLPLIPHEEISLNEIRRISIPIYGMARWGDLFSSRQLLALVTVARLVREAGHACVAAHQGDEPFGQAVQTVLALNVGKAADYGSALATWSSPASQETVRSTFSRQALGMVWDYAEANPFAASSGGWSHNLGFVDRLINAITESKLVPAQAEQASASCHPLPNDSAQAVVTDPPYYDAVPYAHLSDFFYVWLRRALPGNWSTLFAAEAVPKEAEIVVDRPHYLSKSNKGIEFYERELTRAFVDARRLVAPGGIGTIVFASKTTASWEAILKAVIDAGWIITGSWPIDTEREARMAAIGQARLASSVHIVCRPRENLYDSPLDSDVGDWRDVLVELPKRIHEWMPRLQSEGIVGADAIFACLGPALEVFSRYSRVEKPDGDQVPLKEYLEYVWAAVSKEAISMIFEGADTTGFEEDARLTAMWLWTLSPGPSNGGTVESDDTEEADEGADDRQAKSAKLPGFTLEYDAARKIAQGLGAHLELLVNLVEVKGETARLLPVAERTKALFGKEGTESPAVKRKKSAQLSLPGLLEELEGEEGGWTLQNAAKPGNTTLDRLHQAMILFAAGRGEGLRRFLVDEGAGKDQRFWRLAQSLCALYPGATDERRWAEGVLARKKGLGL